MRKIHIKTLCLFTALALVLSFGGCSKNYITADNALAQEKTKYGDASVSYSKADSPVSTTGGSSDMIAPSSGFVPGINEKLIYTGSLQVETKEFDKTVQAAKLLAQNLGGFIESSNVSGDTYYPAGMSEAKVRNRMASITYRVPQKTFDQFFTAAGKLGNVTGSSMNVSNITAQFTDNEAHLKALKTQETRLLELMKKAEKVEDMLTIEKSLSDVRYQIESITSSLRNMQTQVDYSTISLSINEVSDYSENSPAVRTFWQRLGDSVKSSLKNFGRGIEDLIITLVYALPTLIVLGIILFAALFIIKRRALKRKTVKSSDDKSENNH